MRTRRLHILLTAIATFTCSLCAHAQFYSTGADPWNVQWRKIEAPLYSIIFDSCMATHANALSGLMQQTIAADTAFISPKRRPISIVLHSRYAYSNGLMSWAPKRIELYTFPPHDGDCQPWLQHLALHEYRHAIQGFALRRGFGNVVYAMFGEQGIGALMGLVKPLWYLEGDAVTMETAISRSGRGRKAAFEQEMRALTLSGLTPKYDVAYHGSYKCETPDYYHMGYLTVSAKRAANTARRWNARAYNDAMAQWSAQWKQQAQSITPTPFKPKTTQTDDYASYTNLRHNGRNVVALLTSPNHLSRIVEILPDGTERCLATPGIRNNDPFDAHGDTLVWCERIQHPRWENASETSIMIKTGQSRTRRISHGRSYAAPVISPDGTRIAAIAYSLSGIASVAVLTTSGTSLADIPMPIGCEPTYPCWTSDNTLAYVLTTEQGKSIESLDIANGKRTELCKPRYANIRHLTCHQGTLYFTSDDTGIDNIYALAYGKATRITSADFGAAHPLATADTLIYANYTCHGYQIAATPLSTRATDTPSSPMLAMADNLSALTGNVYPSLSYDSTAVAAPSVSYSRWNIINPHSWGLITADASTLQLIPGISLLSQNITGTTTISLGANFDPNESDERYYAQISYNALLPQIAIKATAGNTRYSLDAAYMPNDTTDDEIVRVQYNHKQERRSLSASISLPLTLSRGQWNIGTDAFVSEKASWQSAIPFTATTYTLADSVYEPTGDVRAGHFGNHRFFETIYGASFYIQQRMAKRDVMPRWGISGQIAYRHTPWGTSLGNCRSAQITLYMPGAIRHHSIQISAQAQKKSIATATDERTERPAIRMFGNSISRARGYAATANTQMSLLQCNYTLPIASPDWSAGPVVFVKRIVGRAYFDAAKLKALLGTTTKRITQKSAGAEVRIKSHWLRLPYPVTLGYRFNYLIDDRTSNGDFLLGISF